MANKDVRLVISAKDEATKTFGAVVDALKEVATGNDDAGKSASRTGSLLTQLASDVAGLSRELSSLDKIGKMASDLEKAGKAVDRLSKDTRDSAANFAKSARETERATQATERLRQQTEALKAATDREKAALRSSISDRSKANQELVRSERAYAAAARSAQKMSAVSLMRGAGVANMASAAADVDKHRSAVERLSAAVSTQETRVRESSEALRSRSAALRTAEQDERRLQGQTEQYSRTSTRNRAALAQARTELDQFRSVAQQTGQAMGGLAVRQEEVARRSRETAEALRQSSAEMQAMSRFSDGRGGFTDPKAAQALQKQRAEVARAKADYDTLASAAQRLANQSRLIGPPTRDAAQRMREAAGAARAAKVEYEAQIRVLNQMPGAMGRLNGMRGIFGGIYGESRKAMSVFQRLRGEVLSLATAYVGLYGTITNVGGVITAFQSLEAAQNRLGAVFKQDEAVVARELGFIERQAARLGIQFGVLADQYGKFSVAANAANFEADETRKVFLSVAEAGRVNKLSLDQMQGIFLALEQMISKGKVQSEELRRQLGDRLPGAFNIMADALGVATSELDDMMKKGEVIADSETLLKFADELNKRFGAQLPASLRSTTVLIGQFTNELFQAQLRVAEGGFIDSLNVALAEMNEWFKSREGRDFFLSIGAALGNFVSVLAKVPQYFGVIGMAIKTFISYKLTSMVVGMGVAFSKNFLPAISGANMALRAGTGIAGAYTVALHSLRNAANAAGLSLRAIPGVALFAAATYLIQELLFGWAAGVDSVTASLDEHRRLVGMVSSAYEEAADKAGDWAKAVEAGTNTQLTSKLETLKDAIKQEVASISKIIDDAMAAPTWTSTAGPAYRLTGVAKEQAESLRTLAEGLRRGAIDLDVFRRAVDDIGKRTQSRIVLDLANQFLEVAEKIDEQTEAAKRSEAAIRLLQGTASQADKVLLGLEIATDKSGRALTLAAEAASDYANAIRALKEEIPELAAEMKKLEGLGEIEANYQLALSKAQSFGEAQNAVALRQQAITNMHLKDLPGNIAKSFQLIAGKEGFRDTAYADWSYRDGQRYNSGWRVGYGSDTVTLSDGSIKKVTEGMKIGRDDAIRDLTRRIGEFQGVVKREIGLERWNQFNEQQQAVLTSLAYNYGNLSKTGIVATIKTGDINQISDAIEGLGSHNSGINRQRRADESRLFRADSQDQQIGMEEKRLADQKKINDELAKQTKAVQDIIASREFELRQNEMIAAGKGREAAIEAAITEARRQKADLTDAEIQAISEITGKLYDQKNATDGIKKAEEEVNRLYQYRQELMQMIEYHQQQGEMAQAAELKEQLKGVNDQLREAITNAIEMHKAMGGPDADLAIAKLKNMELSIKGVGEQAILTGQQIAEKLTGVLVGAFKKMAEAIANGEDAWEAFSNAFLQGIAEMLIEIGEMIIRQMILNALQGFLGGFGGISLGARPFHSGGVVGGGGGGPARPVAAGWFRNAVRMHGGGIAGIKPGEMPAILEKGEEVLTEDDPRHRRNGGGSASPTNIKIVNSFDADDIISEGLTSATGEQVLMNVLRANASKVRTIVGG